MAKSNKVKTSVTFKVFNQDFNRAMSEMDSASAKTRKELQLQQEQLKASGTETQKLEAKLESLQKQHEIASDKVKLTSEQLDKAKATFGENSEEVGKMEDKLLSLQIAEQKYTNQVQETQQQLSRYEKANRDLQTTLQLSEQSLDDFVDVLGDDLVKALNDGTANAKQIEQAINKIGRVAVGTDGDLTKLRNALRQIDDGANIDEVRQDLSRLSVEANETEKNVDGLKDSLSGIGGALVGGASIAGTVQQALETSSLNTKIAITFDIPEESLGAVKEATKRIQAYGLDGEEALEAVRRQWALNADATDEVNTKIIEGAGVIASAYNGIDLIELVQEVNEIGASLEVTNEEALALTNSLLKAGFPPEQLDIISEYGLQMKEAGFSAAEIQSIFEKGIDTKTWNIDNLMEGVKELRLQMGAFGKEVPKALEPLLQQAGMSTEQFQAWGKAVNNGGSEGSKALSEMVGWLTSIEDKTLQNEISTAAFGTKWEDQGQNMTAVFQGLSDAQDQSVQNQNELNEVIGQMNQDPTVQFRQALSDIQTSLAPILTVIATVVGAMATWISENTTLTATIVGVVTVVGTIIAILSALAPIVTAVTTVAGALGVSIGAIASPVLIIVGVIGALVAALVAAYTQSETFREGVNTVFEAIKSTIENVIGIVVAYLQERLEMIRQFWDENGTQILQAVENAFNGIKAAIEFVMPFVKMLIEDTWNAIKNVIDGALDIILGIVKTFSSVLTGDWNGVWEGIKQILSGVVEALWGILQLGFLGKIFKVVKKFGDDAFRVIKDMVDKMKGRFDDIVSAGKSKFDDLKNKIMTPVNAARDAVKAAVDKIKGFFNFNWSLPKLKVPKFSISPAGWKVGDLLKGEIPKLGVEWYAKGGIMTRPTAFGINGNNIMAGGEAGPEAILPLKNSVLGTIGKMIANTMPSSNQSVVVNVQPSPIYLDGREIAKATFQHTSNLQHSSVALKAFSKGVHL